MPTNFARIWSYDLNKYMDVTAPSPIMLWSLVHNIVADYGRICKPYKRLGLSYNPGALVDVGANIGQTILRYIAFQRPIVAIEPMSTNLIHLRHNVIDVPNVTIMACAAGNSEGEITISMPSNEQASQKLEAGLPILDNTGLCTPWGKGPSAETVKVCPLDILLKDIPTALLDIDVEGYEIEVLEGAQKTILRDKPLINIELNPINQQMAGRTCGMVVEVLGAMDYVNVFHYANEDMFIHRSLHSKVMDGRDVTSLCL
jgi:FkbM family methyltransferase